MLARPPGVSGSVREDPMPYRIVAQAALDRWRDAERRMDQWPLDSDEWQEAYLEGELAKADYQQAIDDAIRNHKPLPPPFDEAHEG
jgi:uncharacterized protein YdaU (DUF1376 family)